MTPRQGRGSSRPSRTSRLSRKDADESPRQGRPTEGNVEPASIRELGILVIGGGIAGLTAAIEAAEAGNDVFIVEREPSLGGRVAQLHRYFPKLCPPYCGLEINYRRVRSGHRHFKVFTQAEVQQVTGQPGNYEVTVLLRPRYVKLDNCTTCNACVPVCPVERPDSYNYGMTTTKAIYLPHEMAFPMKHVIDEATCLGESCAKCVEACNYDAIDLHMQPRTITLKVGAIVLATGWKPYDANNLEILGFGKHRNIISNVMMDRLAAVNGPTKGEIVRLSDGQPAKRVAFVQCAGSRDVNHLPYCSAICCLATLKQSLYVRERYPDSEVYIFYIDIRPGSFEDFHARVRADERVHFVKGKVAKVMADPETEEVIVEADDMLSGRKVQVRVDLFVLATGMKPNAAESKVAGLNIEYDEYGFAIEDPQQGIYVAGVAKRPTDVATSTRDGTAAALKAIQTMVRK
ncbi:MAG: FAD-dependent oxidoreductase [Chloroflexi bacterium]|nr:FAD-dependent oxidoreductase [Chloroflexota bacterium]